MIAQLRSGPVLVQKGEDAITRGRGAVCTLAIAVLLLAAGTSLPGNAPQGSLARGWPYQPSAFSAERLGRWLLAVGQHEPGVVDEHARAIGAWAFGEMVDAARDFAELRATVRRGGASARVPGCKCTVKEFLQPLGVTPLAVAGDEISKRAVILHTDIVIGMNAETATPDQSTPVLRAGWHIAGAMALVDSLHRDAPADPFARQWYASLAAVLAWQHEVRSSASFVDKLALSKFPSDRDLLMISGCVHEYLASPTVQDGSEISPPIPGNATTHLRQAEKAFRRAIGVGTAPPEVSMRLGRVLGVLGRHDEALSVLKPALASTDATILYFTNLFAGDEEAALGHFDLAQQAYLRAQAIFPSAPTAYLASSRLAHGAGDRARAAAAVRSMLARQSEQVHPWGEYYNVGRRTMAEQLLADLYAPFRKAKTQ